jgi:hypothetical protein
MRKCTYISPTDKPLFVIRAMRSRYAATCSSRGAGGGRSGTAAPWLSGATRPWPCLPGTEIRPGCAATHSSLPADARTAR